MPNSNQKGAAFERKISKDLSTWWSNGEDPNIFWRSQGSGGRATRVRSVTQYGDIHAVDSIGALLLKVTTIELKIGYGSWSPFDAIDGPRKKLQSFIDQVKVDQKKAKTPFFWLIFQRPRRKPCLLAPLYFFRVYYWNEFLELEKACRLFYGEHKYAVVELDEFLKKCSSKNIIKKEKK